MPGLVSQTDVAVNFSRSGVVCHVHREWSSRGEVKMHFWVAGKLETEVHCFQVKFLQCMQYEVTAEITAITMLLHIVRIFQMMPEIK